MINIKRLIPCGMLAFVLFVSLFLANKTAAQGVTGDPWKMLVLVYRNIDTYYVDIDGQTRHLVGTMPQQEADNMVQSFLNQPHRSNVYNFSDQTAELEAKVVYIDRALTDLEPIGNGYWPSPDVTRTELDLHAPTGLYDSVIVFWQGSNPVTGQSIPVNAFGLGYWPFDYANGMTYASVINIPWVWESDVCEGEVFLHEWLHGVTGFYSWLGFSFPYEDLHGAEEAGYTTDENGCWKPWLEDYMQGLVLENGQYKALVPETWHSGSITTHDIQGWRGEFFNNETLAGLPVVVRDDAEVNFHWASDSPHPLVQVDHFSSRWTKEVNFTGGHYLFKAFRDDGLRIFIDGTRVFNEWRYGAEWHYIDIVLSPGWHTVRIEQYEIDGWAGATVEWFAFPGTHETEGNNTPGFADPITSIVHGFVDPAGDIDYYWFSGQAGQELIAEVTAQATGSELDAYLTLYDSNGSTVLAENDDYNGLDSRIARALPNSGNYYLAVRHLSNSGGPAHWYSLSLSLSESIPVTFYVSPATNGTISGIAYTGSDILQYTKSTNTWAMYFDGSDVGVTKNVSAFAILPGGDILMSFAANQVITGQGTFTAQDVARFDPTQTGNNTAGAFAWYFDGSDVALTTSGEKIDALDALDDGRLLISTGGAAAVPKTGGGTLKWQDEDVAAFTATTLGATTIGTWANAVYFDGTAITGLGAEDVSGFWLDETTGDRYLTILGAFKLGSLSGNGKSIVKLPGGSTTPSLVTWTVPPFNVDGLELKR